LKGCPSELSKLLKKATRYLGMAFRFPPRNATHLQQEVSP
jgi:hypothetical protein